MIALAEATEADEARLVELIAQLWEAHDDGASSDRAEVRAKLPVYRAHYRPLMLVRDGKAVGYALVKEMGDHVFIRHFGIDAAHRGTGIGRAAFTALEAAYPGRRFRLDASLKTTAPRAFWEAMGFTARAWSMEREGEAA